MSKVFLTAAWRNLLMANYIADPTLLQKYLPCKTELDEFNGVHYISLVGFLFSDVRIKGIAFPFHTNFEEVNLRFYVRFKEANQWKRGVVFIKEIVPRRMITFIANTLYGENYATHPMKHTWITTADAFQVNYGWKVKNDWNCMSAVTEKEAIPIAEGSKEKFITEHYWGYTHIDKSCTGTYEVAHPKWRVYPLKSYDIHCNSIDLYGIDLGTVLKQQPESVFLADGSPVKIMQGAKVYL